MYDITVKVLRRKWWKCEGYSLFEIIKTSEKNSCLNVGNFAGIYEVEKFIKLRLEAIAKDKKYIGMTIQWKEE